MTVTNEIRFCVQYLKEKGVDPEMYKKLSKSKCKPEKSFVLVRVETSFFKTLAEKLRELWPPGEKDGKYPWRESVPTLVKRLEFIWAERGFENKYTIDDCLTVARRYLSQFEDNVKYMQILKYFIMKQVQLVASDGKVTYTYKSTFADMLESNPVSTTDEWNDIFESNSTYNQGELI